MRRPNRSLAIVEAGCTPLPREALAGYRSRSSRCPHPLWPQGESTHSAKRGVRTMLWKIRAKACPDGCVTSSPKFELRPAIEDARSNILLAKPKEAAVREFSSLNRQASWPSRSKSVEVCAGMLVALHPTIHDSVRQCCAITTHPGSRPRRRQPEPAGPAPSPEGSAAAGPKTGAAGCRRAGGSPRSGRARRARARRAVRPWARRSSRRRGGAWRVQRGLQGQCRAC